MVASDTVTATGSRWVTTIRRVREDGRHRAELLEMLRRLEHPAIAAALPLEHLQELAEVPVRRCLIVRLVVVTPRRHRRDGVEQHRREVDREQLDLFVDVPCRHLVHPLEVRQRVVEEPERGVGTDDARIGCTRRRLLGRREHRLEALPVGERPQAGVGGHQVVEVRGPGAREPADDDRPGDLDVEDLGMARHEVLDAQPVLQQREQEPVRVHAAERVEAGFGIEAVDEDVEAFAEVAGTEVVEPGLGASLPEKGVRGQLDLAGQRGSALEHGGDVRRELRVGEIVDPHGSGAFAHVQFLAQAPSARAGCGSRRRRTRARDGARHRPEVDPFAAVDAVARHEPERGGNVARALRLECVRDRRALRVRRAEARVHRRAVAEAPVDAGEANLEVDRDAELGARQSDRCTVGPVDPEPALEPGETSRRTALRS